MNINKAALAKTIVDYAENERFKASLEPFEVYTKKGKSPERAIQLKAYAGLIRECANQLQYYQTTTDETVEDLVVDASALYEMANEIEKL